MNFNVFVIRISDFMTNNNTITLLRNDGSQELLSSVSGININFIGHNNNVTIYEGTTFSSCSMNLVSGMNIEIGRSKFGIVKLRIFGNKSTINIGKDFSCWGVEIRCHEQSTAVSIGDECMFSEEILIYPTDVHSIFDKFTGEVLNLGKPITIGNHVWCGRGVTFLKGSSVLNDSVIASHSIVTKAFSEDNVVIGGNPAKTLRQGINWARDTPYDLHQKRMLSNKSD